MDDLRTKLKNGDVCLGAWQQIPSAVSAEAMCSRGFDWICVDLEHSRIGPHEVEDTILVAERYGLASLARLPNADPYVARKLLDSGIDGLIVASVESPEEFANFADHCRYPPEGIRGVGLARNNRWGDVFDDHISSFRPTLIPQIESKRGLEALADIARVPDVAAMFIGPYDLSASLGAPGEFETVEFKDALARFLSTCADHGLAPGIHQVDPDPAALREKIETGFRFIAYSTDVLALRHGLKFNKPPKVTT